MSDLYKYQHQEGDDSKISPENATIKDTEGGIKPDSKTNEV
jgi:hypothetical protein